jgi:hypothetical protein
MISTGITNSISSAPWARMTRALFEPILCCIFLKTLKKRKKKISKVSIAIP